MHSKNIFLVWLFYLHCQMNKCNTETITIINIERPVINWFDPEYFKNVSASSRRISRRDYKHYMEMYVQSYITLNNSMKVDLYFYQFLTNRYQPSFVELHFKFCDLLNKDTFLGATLLNALGGRRCPYPPGEYDLKNLTIPFVPKGFPFTKGRIYGNVSLTTGDVTKLVCYGNMDMEIKVIRINNKN